MNTSTIELSQEQMREKVLSAAEEAVEKNDFEIFKKLKARPQYEDINISYFIEYLNKYKTTARRFFEKFQEVHNVEMSSMEEFLQWIQENNISNLLELNTKLDDFHHLGSFVWGCYLSYLKFAC